jgi:hypothetical protein
MRVSQARTVGVLPPDVLPPLPFFQHTVVCRAGWLQLLRQQLAQHEPELYKEHVRPSVAVAAELDSMNAK